jgi:hypothetical protein
MLGIDSAPVAMTGKKLFGRRDGFLFLLPITEGPLEKKGISGGLSGVEYLIRSIYRSIDRSVFSSAIITTHARLITFLRLRTQFAFLPCFP